MSMMMSVKHMCWNFALVYRLFLYECQEPGLIIEFIHRFFMNLIHIRLFRLVVVLVRKIHIFSFPNQCRLLHTIDTRDNPRG